jgi:hypothetical protein
VQTPAGQYLLRLDEVNTGIQNETGAVAQLYPSCAQLEVKSDFTGSLPAGVNIPDVLTDASPGMAFSILSTTQRTVLITTLGMAVSLEMYRRQKLDEEYVYPGGPLWDGTSLVQDKPSGPNTSLAN